MKEQKTAERTWEKTRLSYLVRHKRTGGYYARAYANGKEVWRSRTTNHFSVAENYETREMVGRIKILPNIEKRRPV
jgi:hypothetical protein